MKGRPILITIRVEPDEIIQILADLDLEPTARNLRIARKAIHQRLDAQPGDDDWDRIHEVIASETGIDYYPNADAYDDPGEEEQRTQ